MKLLERFLSLIEYLIETEQRKHIISGILISVAILFISLSVTLVTTK